MRKIKLAIEKINKNNAKDAVANILSGFPLHLGTGYDLELPTRQYFDYCLARVLAHAQIMVRLVVCSKKCALYFVHFLQAGHFIEISTMIISLLGHIWHQARQCLLRLDPIYKDLVTCQSIFPCKKDPEYCCVFPSNLATFLGSAWTEEVDVVADEVATVFASSDVSKLLSVDQSQSAATPEEKQLDTRQIIRIAAPQETESVDMGEVISRETLQPTGAPEVLGKRTLITFLRTENELRGKKSRNSLTRGISQFHWEKFRSLMEAKMRLPNSNIKDLFDKEWVQLRK